ncbi:MAG: hypothetical protein NTZ26_09250 [Candidatus Aminicenantes bacterium]|nr:hypothetical protein [Candidatus Aminicenantes bacterium]
MNKKMMRVIGWAALLALAASPAFAQAPAPVPPNWTPLKFLVGTWEGLGSGAPGEGRGGCTFAFELNENILVRKNWAEYAPKPGEAKGVSHQDLMILYGEAGEPGLKADYFDMESHVIHYVLLPPTGPGRAVFESAPGTKGPRFRLSYELAADGKVLNIFSMAMPGQDFKEYTRGWLIKK